MSFYGRTFLFDGIPSETFSLTISSSDSGSEDKTDLPGGVKIYSEKLFQRTDEFLFGVSIEPILEFPVTFMTDNEELTSEDLGLIGNWLFGRQNYAELQILQPDMQDVIYSCFLLEPKIIRIGNIIRGVECKVHCQHAWGLTPSKTYTYTSSPIVHNNLSDNSGYTYPTLVITVDAFGGDVGWVNISDTSRAGIITALQANEVITLDNNLKIITSSTGLKRLSLFNKKFFRLVAGQNNITYSGAISSFAISYSMARKIGG